MSSRRSSRTAAWADHAQALLLRAMVALADGVAAGKCRITVHGHAGGLQPPTEMYKGKGWSSVAPGCVVLADVRTSRFGIDNAGTIAHAVTAWAAMIDRARGPSFTGRVVATATGDGVAGGRRGRLRVDITAVMPSRAGAVQPAT